MASNHKLYLGMFSFQIKKRNTSNLAYITNNEFLSQAYPDLDNKFTEGFAQDIISLFDAKTFKNKQNTHGGTLDNKAIASKQRYFDVLIDGGLTGIEQFLVDGEGNKEKIGRDKIVGLKFFARFWLPAGSYTGYVFLQRYGGLNIRPLFEEIIKETLMKHGFSIAGAGNTMRPTTTKKRLENFLKRSTIRDITVYSRNSRHETGAGDAQSVTVKLRNVKVNSKDGKIDKKVVSDAMKNHGFTLDNRHYEMSATYVNKQGDKNEEEKTTKLDNSGETYNIIPNILLPDKCIDADGYPIFEEMKEFVDIEIEQLNKEAKK